MKNQILSVAVVLFTFSLNAAAPNEAQNPFADKRATPVAGELKIYGEYAEGCIQGAQPMMPRSAPGWELMNPSRQRFYGAPQMQDFLEYLSQANGKLALGDVAQSNGGPLIGGHASHEIGLDTDLRYEILAQDSKFTEQQLNNHDAITVAIHQVNGLPEKPELPGNPQLQTGMIPGAWNPQLSQLLRTAAEYKDTERIFVSPPIKQQLCAEFAGQGGQYPAWLAKLRPYYGHDDHFHVRLACPDSQPGCKKQTPVPIAKDDNTHVGCEGADINWWIDKDPSHVKAAAKDDDPSFLGEAIWDAHHPTPANPKPKWLRQVEALPPECKAVQKKIEEQLRGK